MTGTIKKLLKDKMCGFITAQVQGAPGGKMDFFFHKSALRNVEYADLVEGQDVTSFEEVEGSGGRGPRAEDVYV